MKRQSSSSAVESPQGARSEPSARSAELRRPQPNWAGHTRRAAMQSMASQEMACVAVPASRS